MFRWTSTVIFWLLFAIIGLVSLLIVLITFAVVKSLPQRGNVFLLNFLFTTCLAQIPPILLFITGQLNDNPLEYLCFTQSVLMDGVGPMFGIALVMLVIQTWMDLRGLFLGKTPITAKFPSSRIMGLLAPYVSAILWCIASLVAASYAPIQLELTQIVYCANNSIPGTGVRRFVGFFMLFLGIIEFAFEALIARLVYKHLSGTKRNTYGKSYITSYHFALRVLIFCILQLTPIILAALNSLMRLNSPPLKNGTHILESMNAVVTFLVFGTSNDLLRTWRLTGTGKNAKVKVLEIASVERTAHERASVVDMV
ncbi:hypothetical protein K439DRAFT_1660093 [Ramaria rubella]|nr:hypothetical protein K439DRAFT_1660093 [Ramaria rubella]